jgi:hypothetical protein
MAIPLKMPKAPPLVQEQRRHQRVKVSLLGRFMLSDHQEYPFQIIDMSPGGLAAITAISAKPGERVIAYVDHLGRLEGTIARIIDNGFAMSIAATLRKRDKLASQLTWLANRHLLNLPEDRHRSRFTPRNPFAPLTLPDGSKAGCRIIDLSTSGAGIEITADRRPPLNAMVTVGKIQGRVIRHIENGFAIEFTRLQNPDFVEENITAK